MHPDEVTWITENVAITNFYSAHDMSVLAEHRVNAVLCLDRELSGDSALERGVHSIRLVHLNDGANPMADFGLAVTSLQELIAKHNRVVVHCRAGRSRSLAVVAAYLTKTQGMSPHAAIEFVRAKRDSAIAPDLIRLVERFGSV